MNKKSNIRNKKTTVSQWKKIRQSVLVRDCGRCRICGQTKKRMSVHHIDGSGMPGHNETSNNRMSNLMTVCPSCHTRLEMKIWKEKAKTHQDPINVTELLKLKEKFGPWISRQKRYQLKMVNSGRCFQCGKKALMNKNTAEPYTQCKYHHEKQKKYKQESLYV